MYNLFLDSDCDVDIKLCKKYGAHLISMPYEIDNKEVYPYETWEEFDDKAFFNLLDEGKLGTTFCITVDKYIKYFEPTLQEGKDVAYIHFSKQMSSTFAQMDEAIKILKEKYPERKFYTVDTKAISGASYEMILDALKLFEKGATAEELIKFIEDEREHYACYFFVDNLKHFARSGRVSGVAAFIGGIVGIRPIIYMSKEGKMDIISKVKGRNSALEAIMQYMDKLGDDVAGHPITIIHGEQVEVALDLEARIRAKYGKDVEIDRHPINPTAGCHAGPTPTGVAFHSISR